MYDVTYCLCFGGSRPIPILSKRWHLLQYHLIYPCNLHIMVLALYRDCYWIPTSWIFLSNKSNLILFCDTYNGKYLHSRHFLFFPIFILSPAKIPVYIYQTLLLSRSTITNYTNPQDISTSSTSTLSFCHHHPQEIVLSHHVIP